MLGLLKVYYEFNRTHLGESSTCMSGGGGTIGMAAQGVQYIRPERLGTTVFQHNTVIPQHTHLMID